MKPSVAVVLLAAGWLGGAGCMSSSSGGGAAPMTDDGAAPLAEPALSALLADGAFRGAGFVQMNPSPFPSTLTPGSFVTVYVSQDAAAAYEAVTPETSTRGADFPVGGILVRQVSDSAGNVTMLS
ncbi:MAG TPA: hypothetical protein VIA18_26745, partial [Polyangia bacterium]|nr:hypothetical protein [Polyangia bacterium]